MSEILIRRCPRCSEEHDIAVTCRTETGYKIWKCYDCGSNGIGEIPLEHTFGACFFHGKSDKASRRGAKSEFKKNDDGKPRMDLLPPGALRVVSEVLTHGARKYGDDNWRKCEEPRRYLAAALRHITDRMDDEVSDTESHLPHIAHAICNLMFFWELDTLESLKGKSDEKAVEDGRCQKTWPGIGGTKLRCGYSAGHSSYCFGITEQEEAAASKTTAGTV